MTAPDINGVVADLAAAVAVLQVKVEDLESEVMSIQCEQDGVFIRPGERTPDLT